MDFFFFLKRRLSGGFVTTVYPFRHFSLPLTIVVWFTNGRNQTQNIPHEIQTCNLFLTRSPIIVQVLDWIRIFTLNMSLVTPSLWLFHGPIILSYKIAGLALLLSWLQNYINEVGPNQGRLGTPTLYSTFIFGLAQLNSWKANKDLELWTQIRTSTHIFLDVTCSTLGSCLTQE